MELVGPGLGSDVDHTASGATIFSRKVRGRNTKFLNRIQRNALTNRGGEQIDVLSAIEQNVGVSGALAIDCNAGTASALHVFTYVAGSSNEIIRIARQRWKIGDL